MTAIVPTNVQLPAHLAERMGQSNITGAMSAGVGGATYKRLSKRGSRFRIRDGAIENVLPDTSLRCIIVGVGPNEGVTKSFYKGAYDQNAKGDDKKPDCYSMDGIRPAKDAEDPQATSCANCPQNVWGSKMSESGNKMKACADQKRLALISADDTSDDPEVYLYTVTPTELTPFANYGKILASKNWPVEMCVTELSFDTTTSYPKMQFNFKGFVPEHMVPVIDRLVQSDIVKEITGNKEVADEPLKAETPKPFPVKPVEPEPEVIIPEVITPAKKSGFGGTPATSEPVLEAKVVQSSNLNDEINDIIRKMKQEEDDE